MVNDLEKFLRQAAERLAAKMEQAQAGQRGQAGQAPPPRQRPSRQDERRMLNRDEMEPDVVDAIILDDPNPRGRGPNPLSKLDTRGAMPGSIDLTDERMDARMHDVFDHDVSQLKPASNTLQRRRLLDPSSTDSGRSEVQHRLRDVSPLIAMLRSPDTLRSAFIASEVFQRKF